MIIKVYSVFDSVSKIERRIGFGNTHGAFVRDNLPIDIYNQQTNPHGLPLNDLQYIYIADYETDSHKFTNLENPVVVDILKSYNFGSENQAQRETPSQADLDHSVEK